MLKDIERPKVTDVAMAIAPEAEPEQEAAYMAYLINLGEATLENVLVRSSGYGVHEGNRYETTELRRFYPSIAPQSAIQIEPVIEEALVLSNQYWVSFYIGKVLYDRKYVFVPGSVDPTHYIDLPFVGTNGVMIK
jgi:hypothetical protein